MLGLALLLLVPRNWIFLLPAGNRRTCPRESGQGRNWLQLQPPPEIQVDPAPQSTPERRTVRPDTFQPADWWRPGVAVSPLRGGDDRPGPVARRDSMDMILDLLGVQPDVARRAFPDSLLEARLKLLAVRDGLSFDSLKPYLDALVRSGAHADMQSRKADMYNDFLGREIMVTPRISARRDTS